MLFDYHLHSDFSADCSITTEQMVQGAIEKGLKEICFTEHIDYEYPDKDFIFEFDMNQYAKEIERLQAKYADTITIKKGIELGLQPYLLPKYEALMAEETFDFVISSIHTADKKGLHSGDFFANRSIETSYQLYYEELLYCVKNFKHYNVLGHLDLVKRYTIDQTVVNDFHDLIKSILNVVITDGKGIELNTSGTRYGLQSGMPSRDILELYKACGGEILTLGSDAHRPGELAYEFHDSLKLFDSIGFKYICTFEKGEPTFHSIKSFI
ncbi:MAG TPA: histidinol-phosphatase HisJ family protein [Pseudogracilibacillus sp.]|nr:histidinol-phosphatase HisJ family protein [Pseudogracilibacillus sp.]